MRRIYVDSSYWIALINRNDQFHEKASEINKSMDDYYLFSTEEVLIEFLNFFSEKGAHSRSVAFKYVIYILSKPRIQILEQSHTSFAAGLNLYFNRKDKDYSMVDCISMETMRRQNVDEILTWDKHFSQEGFKILL